MQSSLNRLSPLPPISNEIMSGTPESTAAAAGAKTATVTKTNQIVTISDAAERCQQQSDLANDAVENLFRELEIRTVKLKDVNDFSTDKYSEDLKFLSDVSRYRDNSSQKLDKSPGIAFTGKNVILSVQTRVAIADKMMSLDVAELYQRAWKLHFSEDFLNKSRDPLFDNLASLMVVMWNMTDKSTLLCQRCLQIQLHQDVLNYMQDERLDPAKTKTYRIGRIMRGLMGILHNMLHRVNEARQPMRDCNGVQIIQRFRQSTDAMVSCKALILQGYLIDETENDAVNSDKETFVFLHKMLSSAVKSDEHYSKAYGFSAEETAVSVNKLAANDSNKQRIVETGFLPLYVSMLQPDFNIAEQTAATHGLWTLAFKCRDDILKEPGCIAGLNVLADTSTDDVVRSQSRGALWILEEKEREKTDSNSLKTLSTTEASAVTAQHVFISYQWDSRSTVLMIRDRVKAAGYKVWVDVDNISGSVLEAMAEAVENAAVVLVCLTHKYKESPNCRTEAEYTFRRRKPLIPLRLEDRYTPDGWLGALCGNNVIYDFSVQSKIETSFSGLMRSLGEIYHTEVAIKATTTSSSKDVISSTNVMTHEQAVDVTKWTQNDIKNWLKTNNISHLTTWFNECDGSMLSEMLTMRRESPDSLYAMLRDDLKLTLKDVLKLNCAFKQLY